MTDIAKVLAEANKMYDDYTANHPTIHCNRFPAWEELDEYDRNSWMNYAWAKVRSKDEIKEDKWT